MQSLINNGFGDVKIKAFTNEIFSSIKIILCNGNQLLKKMVFDVTFDGLIVLGQGIKSSTFHIMENYFCGEEIDINKDNVIQILLFCFTYHDNYLSNICLDLIKESINDKIILEIFEILPLLDDTNISTIRNITNKYLSSKGYVFLKGILLLCYRW